MIHKKTTWIIGLSLFTLLVTLSVAIYVKPVPVLISYLIDCREQEDIPTCQRKHDFQRNDKIKKSIGDALKNYKYPSWLSDKISEVLYNLKITNKSFVDISVTDPEYSVEKKARVICQIDESRHVFAYNAGIQIIDAPKLSELKQKIGWIANLLNNCNLYDFDELEESVLWAPGGFLKVTIREEYLLEFPIKLLSLWPFFLDLFQKIRQLI